MAKRAKQRAAKPPPHEVHEVLTLMGAIEYYGAGYTDALADALDAVKAKRAACSAIEIIEIALGELERDLTALGGTK